jgi:hypothetical protein
LENTNFINKKLVKKPINRSKSFLGNSKYCSVNSEKEKNKKVVTWTFDAIKNDYYIKSRCSKILLATVNIITVILSVLNIVFK